jgi:hypothetical protein
MVPICSKAQSDLLNLLQTAKGAMMSNAALQKRATAATIRTDGPSPQGTAQPGVTGMDGSERQARIAQAAYFRAERRGFTPGCELDDWLAAEEEVDSQTNGR